MHTRNCLSNWFPRLEAAGLPVPRTEIVRLEGLRVLHSLIDGVVPDCWPAFEERLRAAIATVGGAPCFLRTGQGSGKHQWDRCCHLTDPARLVRHVAALIEWSETVDMLGLPSDVWVVRELLPVRPLLRLDRYGGMPLVREFRAFVAEGDVVCIHRYWPAASVCEGLAVEPENLADVLAALRWQSPRETSEVTALASAVARAFEQDGAWSVDLLETDRGWYVTDMADAGQSFHWPGCQQAPRFLHPF